MSIHSCLCGSSDFRFSRLRFKDLPRLLLFQYPMRCWVCRDRNYMTLPRILRVVRDAPPRAGRTLSDDQV